MKISVIVIGNEEARARELGYQAEYDNVHRDCVTNRWKPGDATTITVDASSPDAAMDMLTDLKFSVYYAERNRSEHGTRDG